MKAISITTPGAPEVLQLIDAPDPQPAAGEVLLRVAASAVNRADLLQARGLYPPPAGYSPNMPGLEFAGEVVGVGPTVSRWKTGDRVFGILAAAGQAEFVLTHADLLAAIPDSLDFVDAAAIPEAFITAHDAIVTQAALREGETLLVHAVGSGVGLAGLQLGKAIGAKVIGTSRTAEKLARCVQFGLDLGIETEGHDFVEKVLATTSGLGVDVILDLVGGPYFQQNLACLAMKGRLMLVGLTAGRSAEFDMGVALQKRLTIRGTTLRARSLAEKADATARFAAEVGPLLTSGKVRPNVDSVFPVSDVTEAYARVGSNANFGKVILEF